MVSRLRVGNVIHIVSLVDEWWLVVMSGCLVDVYKKNKTPSADNERQSYGRLYCPPTISEHETIFLYGEDGGVSKEITIESLKKVDSLPK